MTNGSRFVVAASLTLNTVAVTSQHKLRTTAHVDAMYALILSLY